MIAFLQMRSQSAILLLATAGAACGGNSAAPVISHLSLPEDSPDLSLQGVAFARLSDGRVVSRGTARHLDYRRAGGRLVASDAAATIVPEAGTGLASFGVLQVQAPHVEGEIVNRRGDAKGGVRLDTGRGDHARTDAVHYDGAVVTSDTHVVASGPGYSVESNGMVARADGSAVHLTRGVNGRLELEARR